MIFVISELMEGEEEFWFILGGILLIFEVLISSSYFLLWIGISAVIIGLIVCLVSLSWEWQGIIFSLFTVILTWLWCYRFYVLNHRNRSSSILNQRDRAIIGLRTRLSFPIINGRGSLRIGDGFWIIKANQDLPSGTYIEVYDIEGIKLNVRPIMGELSSSKEDIN